MQTYKEREEENLSGTSLKKERKEEHIVVAGLLLISARRRVSVAHEAAEQFIRGSAARARSCKHTHESLFTCEDAMLTEAE